MHTCTAMQLVLQGVLDLLLDVVGDVATVRNVADAGQRHRLAELPADRRQSRVHPARRHD